ncbi:LysR family transcriptional regulator [Cognatishimia activa]|uniref:HTH-type transcriptional regulator GltC n=1 Tax=Cognatishimia activa TaxID=1715691 RepID=A0A0N7MBP0_9RHOB|nr:LysR family transcriptional regulator [Cognatishimia activa]CUI97362.1 HTH-type transcriptional regulator GltC [Cognatishimia activa]CUK25944.1 HTH-type transcriptional regulator GltC [Cognatishimia activa]
MRKLDNYLTARQFEYFAEIIRAGSLNKAARNLGQTQSALTRSLKQLEKSMGSKLVDRGPRGAFATPQGELLMECYHRVSLETRLAFQAIAHTVEAGRSTVHVGAAPSFGLSILPSALQQLRTRFPELCVKVYQETPASLLQKVKSGDIDIYMGPLVTENADSDLTFECLNSIPSRVYVRRGHPLEKQTVVTNIDLLSYRWVSLLSLSEVQLPGSWRENLDKHAYEQGLQPPIIDIETTSIVGALNFVSGGDHLVCLSQLLMHEAELRGLKALNLQQPLTSHLCGLVYRKAVKRNPELGAVLEVFKTEFMAAAKV